MSAFLPEALKSLGEQIVALLKQKGESVAVAETACGGLISAALLAQPGASRVYRGGLTLYTLPSRILYGGWTQADISAYKGPTVQIVAQLATHTRGQLESTYSVGESGTAGPTGGETRERTPGFCALAVATPDGAATREFISGHGKRDENMVEFAQAALGLLLEAIQGKVKPDDAGLKASV